MIDDRDARMELALQSCQAGTATLAQYEMIFGGTLGESRRRLLASTPLLVAREEAGGRVTAAGAIAYPPQVPLPASVRQAIGALRATATQDPFPSWGSVQAEQAWVVNRAQAAWALLVLGGDEAIVLRRRAWVLTGDGAVPSDEVVELAGIHTVTVKEADAVLGLEPCLAEVARSQVRPGDVTAVYWLLDNAQVSYSALAQIVGLLDWPHAQPRPVPGLFRWTLVDSMLAGLG